MPLDEWMKLVFWIWQTWRPVLSLEYFNNIQTPDETWSEQLVKQPLH